MFKDSISLGQYVKVGYLFSPVAQLGYLLYLTKSPLVDNFFPSNKHTYRGRGGRRKASLLCGIVHSYCLLTGETYSVCVCVFARRRRSVAEKALPCIRRNLQV